MGSIPFFKQPVKLTFTDETGALREIITIDASISETHHVGVDVTRHPVAKGIALTDNIRAKPDDLTLVAFFTNYGSRIDESIKKLTLPSAQDTFGRLDELAKGGMRCEVKTSLKTYKDMVIEDMSVPRDAGRGNVVEVTIKFVQIATAQAKIIAAPEPKKTANAPVKAAGAKPQPPANAAQGSVAVKAAGGQKAVSDGISNFLKGVGRSTPH